MRANILLFILLSFLKVNGQMVFPTSETLSYNNANALFYSDGNMFWDTLTLNPAYEIPKGSGKISIYANGLWIGGLDASEQLRLSTIRYRSGQDFFPGPVITSSSEIPLTYIYNDIYKIRKSEIDSFITFFQTYNPPNYTIPESILNWPVSTYHQHPEIRYDMAPFYDYNGDGYYNPNDGDYPCIKGDEMLYWVMNDDLQTHTESGGLPLGIQVNVSAWQYNPTPSNDTMIALSNTTFMRYQIRNLSPNTYHNTYIGIFTDGDLGNGNDDFIGSDVGRNSFYFYNGDLIDGDGSGTSYGANPPVQAVVLLKGPLADQDDGIDNDRDNVIDETNENITMSKFTYFINNGSTMSDPVTAAEYYNYLQGKWKDGTSFTYGGNGHLGYTNADFAFPGSSDPYAWGTQGIFQPSWSEITNNNTPGDRRGVMSSGPFTIEAGNIINIDVAYVWSRMLSGAQADWISNNQADIDKIRSWYNINNIGNECSSNYLNSHLTFENKNNIQIYPNPCSESLNINFSHQLNSECIISIIDLTGRPIISKSFNKNSNSLLINTNQLDKGIYLLKIKTINEEYTKKIIKK